MDTWFTCAVTPALNGSHVIWHLKWNWCILTHTASLAHHEAEEASLVNSWLMMSHGCITSLAETQQANKEQHHFSVLKLNKFWAALSTGKNMASHWQNSCRSDSESTAKHNTSFWTEPLHKRNADCLLFTWHECIFAYLSGSDSKNRIPPTDTRPPEWW